MAPAVEDGPDTLPTTEDGFVVTPALTCRPCADRAMADYAALLDETWRLVEAEPRDDLSSGYRSWPGTPPLPGSGARLFS